MKKNSVLGAATRPADYRRKTDGLIACLVYIASSDGNKEKIICESDRMGHFLRQMTNALIKINKESRGTIPR